MNQVDKILYDQVEEYNSKPSKPPKTPVDIKETPQKCVFESENDESVVKVQPGEICTIDAAKTYGVFGKDKYFSDVLPSEEVSETDIFLKDKDDNSHKYSLCEITDDNNIYQNCSISTRNPWKTIDSTKQYCMLSLDILDDSLVPKGLRIIEGTKTIQKPAEVPVIQPKKSFCQEKWYDWFSIPDYHHDNMYTVETNESNDSKCYAPCNIGYVPHRTNKNNCMRKQDLEYGKHANSFHYLPIPLIILLGSTKDDILSIYKQNILKTRNNSNDISLDIDILGDLLNNEKSQNKIFEDVRKDLNYHINQLLALPFDETNIIPPTDKKHELLFDIEKIEIAYNIAKKFHNVLKEENPEIFQNFKKNLCSINGLQVSDNKLFKQLLILKKACNVAFDNKTSYSSDIILYTLNKNKNENETKQPISFEITDDDIVLSLSENSAERTTRDEIVSLQSDIRKKKQIIKDKIDFTKEDIKQSFEFVSNEYDEKSDEVLQSVSVKKSWFYDPMTYISGFFLMIFIILGIYLIYLISNMFWTPITTIINKIILSYYSTIFTINDLLSGGPPTYHLKMNELQQGFLEAKLSHDTKI